MSFHQLYKTTIYDGDAGLNKTLEVVNIWHLSGLIGSFFWLSACVYPITLKP